MAIEWRQTRRAAAVLLGLALVCPAAVAEAQAQARPTAKAGLRKPRREPKRQDPLKQPRRMERRMERREAREARAPMGRGAILARSIRAAGLSPEQRRQVIAVRDRNDARIRQVGRRF